MSGIIGVSPDMRSGVVGKYPVGHVLQVVRDQNTSNFATSATDGVANKVTPESVSFILKSTNPMIYASYQCQSGSTNDTVSWKMDCAWNVDGGSYTQFGGGENGLSYEYHSELGDGDIRRPKNIMGSKIITANIGQTVIIAAWAWGGHLKATSFGSYHDLTVMEIQQ
jgi:hypothetical protein